MSFHDHDLRRYALRNAQVSPQSCARPSVHGPGDRRRGLKAVQRQDAAIEGSGLTPFIIQMEHAPRASKEKPGQQLTKLSAPRKCCCRICSVAISFFLWSLSLASGSM